jgi:hypothetical protein
VSHDPQRFAAQVRKATAEGPFTVEPTEAGFVLSAEITGPSSGLVVAIIAAVCAVVLVVALLLIR